MTNEATTDVGGGNAAAFIEDGDWISFNPYNLEDLIKVTFRVASAGAGGIIQLRYDAADGPLVAETPNIAPTGGWQTWRTSRSTCRRPSRRARTACSSCSVTRRPPARC